MVPHRDSNSSIFLHERARVSLFVYMLNILSIFDSNEFSVVDDSECGSSNVYSKRMRLTHKAANLFNISSTCLATLLMISMSALISHDIKSLKSKFFFSTV